MMPQNTYGKERRIRAFFASRSVVLILFFLMLAMGLATFRVLVQSWDVAREREVAEHRVSELKDQRDRLTQEVELLEHPAGIEREARERLNLHEPGEEVVIIQDASGGVPKNIEPEEPIGVWESITKKIQSLFE